MCNKMLTKVISYKYFDIIDKLDSTGASLVPPTTPLLLPQPKVIRYSNPHLWIDPGPGVRRIAPKM